MTCRAPSSATTCSGTQTGQQLSYDAEENLSIWQNQPTPTSTVNYLYDGEGTRVASQLVSGGNTTLTSYLGKLETIVAGSSSTTTTYYSAGALRIAEAVNGTFSYLGNDVLGSTAVGGTVYQRGYGAAEGGFDPWGLLRYAYVKGNPETLTDPTGHYYAQR